MSTHNPLEWLTLIKLLSAFICNKEEDEKMPRVLKAALMLQEIVSRGTATF